MTTPNLGALRRLAPAGGSLPDGGPALAVRFERTFTTTPVDLWDALTRPERVVRWMGELTGDLRAGGDFVIDLTGGDPESEARNWGRVVECEPGRRLLITWEAPGGQATSEVEVTTSAVGQGDAALLTLEHRALPEAAARGYGAGWHDFLDQLDADLAGRPQADWDALFAEYLPVYRELPVADDGR
ncbi:SRPBCC family protein [Antribacter gilvus]|uniref:SRPBCC family protein n=1 Tax=Antribacter gilvus TaxID=2304675 RepID=UPI000F7A64BB|nr:SRPBCC family protein [Antribacter gilvus]